MTVLFFFRCNNKSDNKYKCWNMVLLKKKIQNPPDLPVILKRVAAGGETVISPV